MRTCQYLLTLSLVVLGPVLGVEAPLGSILRAGGDLIGSAAQAAEETPREMLAAQLRLQGIPCDKPLSALKDAKRSKPDRDVWVLKCSNASYRISRVPDMAAKVERLR
jgi:hypothetical protein